jgi:hypothetical protein
MRRHEVGPRRSQSVDAFLRSTRLLAIAALVALAGGIASDVVGGSFWARHALLASLTANVIIVLLTVAVINEVLERRRRERWRILAQFVMLELVRNARLIWTGVLTQVGLLSPQAARPESVEANGLIVRDTPRLTVAVCDVIADDAVVAHFTKRSPCLPPTVTKCSAGGRLSCSTRTSTPKSSIDTSNSPATSAG